MKKVFHKIQDLSQKAAHLKQVIEAAPAQAAHLRDTMLMTASQLQQLKHDVQSSVTGLRADTDDRLAQALREISDSAATFHEAGYALAGVDMEISPIHHLIVHLEKIDDASDATLRSLVSANSGRPTVYAILSALTKADAISERIHVSHLHYHQVVIRVGPTPSIRLTWRPEGDPSTMHPQAHAPILTSAPPPPPIPGGIPGTPLVPHTPTTATPTPAPTFSQSTYFEHPTVVSGVAHAPTSNPSSPSSPSIATTPPTPSISTSTVSATPVSSYEAERLERHAGGDWKKSALDRFKKMPDGSKYRR